MKPRFRQLSPWTARTLLQFERNPEEPGVRFQQLAATARREAVLVSAKELPALMARRIPLLDVRQPSEYCRSHIPQSRCVPRGILEPLVERDFPELGSEIVLYCRGGNRSALAAASLKMLGYDRIRVLDGGLQAWILAGGPVVSERSTLDD